MPRFERWLEVKAIFEEALELNPDERTLFLDRACRDVEVRQEVEALLAAPALPTSSLGSLLGLPEQGDEPDYAEGDTIDHFVIVRRVGRGGMGVVYEARDTKNNDRTVALKVLLSRTAKLSQDKRLAGFSHPSIVTFHDSGETPEGLPYFVFEYIEGEPITTFCDHRALDIPARLRLFQKVCDAVRYAHERLIIHCDLKPENILVTATGTLKLLDFGIAKGFSEATGSQYPSPVTLPFASPEQVGGEETTTLSDVYSLGVLLSVLLTGHLPYDDAQSLVNIRDAILYGTPTPPSLLVIRRGDEARADENTPFAYPLPPTPNPGRLARRLRGDLDTIALTCLRKEPTERYHTPQEISDEIERHLTFFPLARRHGLLYWIWKLLRRRRRTALAVATIVPLLLFLVLRWYSAHVDALAEFARADELDTFLHRAVILYNPENISRYESVLQDTVNEVLANIRQPEAQVELLNALGVAYQNAKLFEGAKRSHEAALKIARSKIGPKSIAVSDTLAYLGTLARIQNDYPRAEVLMNESLAILSPQVPETDSSLTYMIYQLARLQEDKDDDNKAEPLHRRALLLRERALPSDNGDEPDNYEALEGFSQSLTALGTLWGDMYKNLDRAEWLLRLSLALRERIYTPDEPRIANTLSGLAEVLEKQGRIAESENLRREASRMYHSKYSLFDPETIVGDEALGRLLLSKGSLDEAGALLGETLKRAREKIGTSDPRTIRVSIDLALVQLARKKTMDADALLKEAYSRTVHNPKAGAPILARIVIAQARCSYIEGNYSLAEAQSRMAIEIFQGLQHASSGLVLGSGSELGNILADLHLFHDAEAILLNAYRRAPWRPDTLNALIRLYSVWGKPEKTIAFRQQLESFKARYKRNLTTAAFEGKAPEK